MIFDTHAHFDDKAFDNDREEVLNSLKNLGIMKVANVAASMESIVTTVDLAHRYEDIYAVVGVHPEECNNLTAEDMETIRRLALTDRKVVAIGEIGLDYNWDDSNKDLQKKWFSEQLKVALELGKPVVIHSRDAAADTLDIVKSFYGAKSSAKCDIMPQGKIPGVIHCFSYEKEMALEYIKMGFVIGVGGVVTFKNGRKLKETVENIPLEYIVTETDCPYLAPVPYRGTRNFSGYIPLVIEEIAKLKGISCEEVEQVTWNNALRLYGLK